MKPLKTNEIVGVILEAGVVKAKGSFIKLAILGILAGIFIALAAYGSTMGSFNLLADPNSYGLGRVIAGSLFTVGLMLVVTAGFLLATL